jgi:hypothetical protein
MTDLAPSLHEPHSLRFTFGALWRTLLIVSLALVVAGSFDGGDLRELIVVPLVVAAWMCGIYILDRWVMMSVDQK